MAEKQVSNQVRASVTTNGKTYWEDKVKVIAGDDNDQDEIAEDPGRDQLRAEGLERIIEILARILLWWDVCS